MRSNCRKAAFLAFLVLFTAASGCGQSQPYDLTGDVVTVYGHQAVPDVGIAFSNGFGTTQTLADGTWSIRGVSGPITISAAKDGWFFFPSTVSVKQSTPIRFLAAPNSCNKILFTRNTDTGSDIWVMDPDGSNQSQITFLGNCDSGMWSPDGTKIAFSVGGSNEVQIWTMNSDGTGKTKVAGQANFLYSYPSWSPDGNSLIFFAAPGPNHPDFGKGGYLRIVSLDDPSLPVHELTVPVAGLLPSPARWSPDGEWIAFTGVTGSVQPLEFDIYIIRPDGTGLTRVTSKDSVTSQMGFAMVEARWSPDGRRLVFAAGKEGTDIKPFQIYVINRDGTGLTKLTNTEGSTYGPSWSPDGKKIVFGATYGYLATDPRQPEIYVINADGTGLGRLSNPDLRQTDANPCWSAF